MPRNKVDVAKRMVDAHNSRDVDGLFAELHERGWGDKERSDHHERHRRVHAA